MSAVEITFLYFDDCPHWQSADQLLTEIAADRPDLVVTRQEVRTGEEAERLTFHGSPSILINGVDPFATEDMEVGLACRMYETPDGIDGAPTLEQLRAAIDRA